MIMNDKEEKNSIGILKKIGIMLIKTLKIKNDDEIKIIQKCNIKS